MRPRDPIKKVTETERTRKEFNSLFRHRYYAAADWIESKLMSGQRRGIIRLLFWRFPLIYLEGKVIGAFFSGNETETPSIDTVSIEGSREIFKFETFKTSFLNAVKILKPTSGTSSDVTWRSYELLRESSHLNHFDFYDYFGLPRFERYKCAHFEFNILNGRVELWVIAPIGEQLLRSVQLHANALSNLVSNLSLICKRNDYKITDQRALGLDRSPQTVRPQVILSDYMMAAFTTLHKGLLEALDLQKGSCRLFITMNDKKHGPGIKIFLTQDQKAFYEEHVPKLREGFSYNTLFEQAQSGTVSSIFHQRGISEFFLEDISFADHPIIKKSALMEKDLSGYSYPPDLRKAEGLYLADAPKKDGKGAPQQFLMVPYFFMGHSFGCIAYFIPNKMKFDRDNPDKKYYYDLKRVFDILSDSQGRIYRAALQDLAQDIIQVGLTAAIEDAGDSYKTILSKINGIFPKSLFSERYEVSAGSRLSQYPNLRIKDYQDEFETEDNGEKLRLYRIKDRTLTEAKTPQGFLLCKDPADLYSSWEKQNDLDILANIEMSLQSYKRRQQVLQHGVKAAVSAIISRNHSHHIGSHVTPRTTVEKIRERLAELRGISDPDKQLKALGFMREQLDDYIQRKADFMAEIATDPISSTSNKALFGEILLPFVQNSLLMDNIAANEGIRYRKGEPDAENRLKIRAKIITKKEAKEEAEELSCKLRGDCTCLSDYSSLTIPYGSFCKCGPEHRLNLVSPIEQDIVIALPGQLGEFAIYCFLENLIRNSVKHSPKQLGTDEDVNIFLEVSKFLEGDPDRHDFYSVEIYDTITKPDTPINGKPLIDHLINFKNDKIIENDGRLKSGAWGIAEMKIMATLLAGSTDFLTMERNLEICSKKIDGQNRLVYKLRFMRPKQVAVIGEKRPYEAIEKRHKDRGIFWFNSVDEYSKAVMSGRSPASFEFIAVPSDQVGAYQHYAHLCPYRVLVVRKNNQNSEVATGMVSIAEDVVGSWAKEEHSDGIDRIVLACWRNWVSELKQRHFGDNSLSLGLYLQQKKDVQPTSQYITLAEEHNQFNPPLFFSLITDTENSEVVPIANSGTKWLIFDRHFGGWGQVIEVYDDLEFRDSVDFHEGIGKSSSDFVPIFSGNPSLQKVHALMEAAMLRILVLDERIAEVAYTKIPDYPNAWRYENEKGAQRIFVARYAGVFIATHIRVNNKAPEPLHESVKGKSPCCCAWVKTLDDGSIASVTSHWCETNHAADCTIGQEQCCDALLIHQGVAESRALRDVVTRNGRKDFRKAFGQFIKDASRTIPYIVVHSGRGIPANLPSTSKFMPFSRLEEYLMKDRLAKFALTQRIMTTIRRRSQ